MEKMARVTTALGGNTITGRTMCCHLDAPSNAISVCRDAAQVVVAGRNIFKIYSIEEDQFVEKLNLRVGRKPSLNFSCADVVWHQMDENLLATAATNGVVVTWNLGKPSRNKQDQLFMEHKRTVNKVCFHPTEVYMLLSGSQDGYMKCFDLRKKDSVSTFSGQSESVRDVQFSIRDYFTFAATFENGNVQLWDIRRPDRYERMFTAHNGPVFCCDWHPEDRGWLATGGRDKMVKVWDMNTNRAKEIYCVQTIASVARVKWRPECKHHIATCSMMVDHNIYVWDIRRPFIPSAMFEEHKDVTTGIVWRHLHDPYFLLSGSKDSTLYQHIFKDASQPIERANPEGLCYSLFGDLAFAAKESLISSDSNRKPYLGDRRHPIFFKRKLDPTEQFEFISSSSALSVFEADAECDSSSMDWFVRTAKQYVLTGRPLAELCDHNAKVAKELKRNQVAQTWTMLRIIYSSPSTVPTTNLNHSLGKSSSSLPLMNSFNLKDIPSGIGTESRLERTKGENRPETILMDSSSTLINNDENEETEGSDVPADYLLGDVEADEDDLYMMDHENPHPEEQEYILPQEAFPLRHEIVDNPSALDHLQDKADSPHVSGNEAETVSLTPVESFSLISISHSLYESRLPADFFNPIVHDMLLFYAEQGDVQMAVSVLIVLGDRIKKGIDDQAQEHWYTSYIDLLQRFQLWNISNEVIKLSTCRAINCLNQASTTLHINCSNCKRPMSNKGWICDRCRQCASMCAVCHHVVKGLFVWCQGCSHGGHLQHIMKWLETSSHCPTGCGHLWYSYRHMERKMSAMACTVFNELRLEGKLCDVIIKVNGCEFNAHKNILCSCSSYFRALFTSSWNNSEKRIYNIPGITPDMMKLIIEYAYTRTVPITVDNVERLLVAADQFNVMGIVRACSDFMKCQLCLENCIGICKFTEYYFCPELRQAAYMFILHNFEEMVKASTEFLELSVNEFKDIIEKDELNVKQEDAVFEAILKWIAHDPANRKQQMAVLLPKVRLALMHAEYFMNNVKMHDYVKDSDECKPIVIDALKAMYDLNMNGPSSSDFTNPLTRPRLPYAILFAIGGWSGGSPTNAIETYDARADRWVNVTCQQESPRAYHGAAYLKGYVYIIGGFDSVDYFNSVKRFEPIKKTWHQVAPMHSRRCYVSVTVLDNFIYAMGGFDGYVRLNTAERYEPETNQWTLIAPMHEQRSDASATTLYGKVYICGGFNGNECLFTAEVYDAKVDQWSLIAPMRSRRSGIGVIAYGEHVYAHTPEFFAKNWNSGADKQTGHFGSQVPRECGADVPGQVGGFDGANRLRSAEAYNPIANTWRTIPTMFNPRSNFGIEVVDDLLFVVGGFNGFTTTFNVECYDEKTDEWYDAHDMSIYRSALSCCVVPGLPNVGEYAARRDNYVGSSQRDEVKYSSSTSTLPV